MAISAAEIEDGTGKSTAIVYETLADAQTWLDRRGLTAFGAATAAAQEAAHLKATAYAEEYLRLIGYRVTQREIDQGLTFPATDATNIRGELRENTETPIELLEAIRLIDHEMVSGTFMVGEDAAGVQSEEYDGAKVDYSGTNGQSLTATHPVIARRLLTARGYLAPERG